MAEYLRQRNPSFSVHTTLGWTIVKTRYAPVQYVLLPRTLTT
jgi:CDP-diacylglycerol pyrophosphatase